MEAQQSIPQQDEIDLREYARVVIKQKKLILGVVLLSLVVSIATVLFLSKTYEISSLIQLGSIDDFLINREEAKQFVLNQDNLISIIDKLDLDDSIEGLKKRLKLYTVADTNLLGIKILGSDVDTSIKIHDLLIEPLFKQGTKLYGEKFFLKQKRLEELDEEINNVQSNISRTQELISGLPRERGVSQNDIYIRIILLQISLQNYELNLNALRNQKKNIQKVLLNSKEFKVFSHPLKPEKPIAPKKTQIVIFAGLIGLFAGLFLAFVSEYRRPKQ